MGDGVVISIGTALAVLAWREAWWMAFTIVWVIGHFFLFCNVVRLSRHLELMWAAAFLLPAIGTVKLHWPGWAVTILASSCATLAVSIIEARKPSYHGILWHRVNPGLKEWWDARNRSDNEPSVNS